MAYTARKKEWQPSQSTSNTLVAKSDAVTATGRARSATLSSIVFYISTTKYRGVAQFGRALRSGRRSRRFESCHLDHKEGTALVAVFSLCLRVARKEPDLRSKCRFAFTARRSASLLARRRACESSRTARIPCHPFMLGRNCQARLHNQSFSKRLTTLFTYDTILSNQNMSPEDSIPVG